MHKKLCNLIFESLHKLFDATFHFMALNVSNLFTPIAPCICDVKIYEYKYILNITEISPKPILT